MPFVIVEGERIALAIGDTSLGGSGDDALAIQALASHPPLVVVSVLPDHAASARRVGEAPARLNGIELGASALPLSHGAVLEVAGVRVLFGDIRESGRTSFIASIRQDELALLGGLASEPTADTGGKLVRPGGDVVSIPDQGLTIGRDPECGLVLSGLGASRRHATVAPTLQGYVLTDVSANGTYVNGRRIDGSQLLGFGDVIRIGETELRFEADQATFEPPSAPSGTEPARAAAPLARPTPPRPAPPLLATLEVINEGVLKGLRFRIERPVVHVGRGEHNDVRLQDGSVSGSHASLTRRGAGWVVLDLGSTNGTYVDGDRIAGEQKLPSVAELRFGNVKVVFRQIGSGAPVDDRSRTSIGIRSTGSGGRR